MANPFEDPNNALEDQNEQDAPTFQFTLSQESPEGASMATLDGKRKRVGFTQDTTPPIQTHGQSSPVETRQVAETVTTPGSVSPPGTIYQSFGHTQKHSISDSPLETIQRNDISDSELSMRVHAAFGQPYVPKPRPAIRKTGRTPDVELNDLAEIDLGNEGTQKAKSGLEAHDRAQKLAAAVGSYNASASVSRRNSVELDDVDSSDLNINPITRTHTSARPRPEEKPNKEAVSNEQPPDLQEESSHFEAERLVRSYTQKDPKYYDYETAPMRSGQITPIEEQSHAEDYIPKPEKYRGGVLAALLKLRNQQDSDGTRSPHSPQNGKHSSRPSSLFSFGGTTPSHTPNHSPPESGASTPTNRHSLLHWPRRHGTESPYGISHLIGSSSTLALPQKEFGEQIASKGKQSKAARPGLGMRSKSGDAITSAFKRMKPRFDEQIKITVHIAETLARQKYLVKLCRALMEYGAPTHRLEEYMKASSRVLEIESQFLYIPGCMLISFDDPTTHTTEVKLVRIAQGVNLGKLRDTHRIYKLVVHDLMGVEEATKDLEEVVGRKQQFNRWFLVFVYGLASVSVGPFAFQARLIDLPVAFILGCLLGFLQLIVAPRSDLYANIFEISAAIFTSFLARGFGSIPNGKGGTVFCFSALAQSSIALILPGYTVLCASLELQSRSIVAGSVRMVYAIIYSLFLGFGITIGTVIYGMMDHNATSATTCSDPMSHHWFFFFVPCFTMCLIIINQAKWKQAPVMMVISFAGYLVNFFSSQHLVGNTQVSQTLGALTIGLMANLYARLGNKADNFFTGLWENRIRPLFIQARTKLQDVENPIRRYNSNESKSEKPHTPRRDKIGYGMAAAAMLPAIFVQVPSGLAVSGSLVAGITSANQIVGNVTGTTTVSSGSDTSTLNSAAFNVGYSVIQVAIGITVGLFLSALVVYPFGKRRSGLFSF